MSVTHQILLLLFILAFFQLNVAQQSQSDGSSASSGSYAPAAQPQPQQQQQSYYGQSQQQQQIAEPQPQQVQYAPQQVQAVTPLPLFTMFPPLFTYAPPPSSYYSGNGVGAGSYGSNVAAGSAVSAIATGNNGPTYGPSNPNRVPPVVVTEFGFAPGTLPMYCGYNVNPLPVYNTPYKKCIPNHPMCGLLFTCILDVDPKTGQPYSVPWQNLPAFFA